MKLRPKDAALVDLGRWLRAQKYSFTTVTPLTHSRVNARPEHAVAQDLRGIFGWSRPFPGPLLPTQARALLERSGELHRLPDGNWRSGVRFSTLEGFLLAHSAFPTDEADSVFLGPDTSRFVSLLKRIRPSGEHLVEVGSGTGVGGLVLASQFSNVTLCDINVRALRYSQINAVLAAVDNAQTARSDVLDGISGPIDCVIANPPYLVDSANRTYRHGGEQLGTQLALRIVEQSLKKLRPGGTLVLYTGAPIVDGKDIFQAKALDLLSGRTARTEYNELDPDIFGEELESPAYRSVDRLAAVALLVTRSH